MDRTVRRCYLMRQDEFTGRNYDYREDWIEQRLTWYCFWTYNTLSSFNYFLYALDAALGP